MQNCLLTNVTFHSSCLTTSSTNSAFFLVPIETPRTLKHESFICFAFSFTLSIHLQPSFNLVNGELSESSCPVQCLHVQLPSLILQFLPCLTSFHLWSLSSPRLITLLVNLFVINNNGMYNQFDTDHLCKELLRSSTEFFGHPLKIRHSFVLRGS